MIVKTVNIDGKGVPFKASAAIPRMYRLKFRRDIFKDLAKMEKSMKNNGEQAEDPGSDIPIEDLEMFENIAYIMAKHADKTIPDDINDWLDRFNTFSIYTILPEILEMWGVNAETEIESKKNQSPLAGK